MAIPRSVVPQSLLPLWRRNVLIISVALALLALGLLIASQTALHVNRLRSAAEQIADGNLSPPARIPSPNREFSQLQDAFIQMAGNLRDTRDALDRQVEQERKMNETLHSLERQVVGQERLAAVGVLVSGVAHELNNPLQAILGTAELLERQPNLSSAALDEISFLKTQSGRAREIIRNLSRFSSQQSGRHRRSTCATSWPRSSSSGAAISIHPASCSTSRRRRHGKSRPTSPSSSR